MKLKNKLVPIAIATSSVVAIAPITLTSCGNIYTDMLHDGYTAKFTPLDKSVGPLTDKEATALYLKALKDPEIGAELIKDDLLVSANNLLKYAGDDRYDVSGDKGKLTFTRYVFNVQSVSFDPNNVSEDGHFILSYKIAGEMEIKMEGINGSDSYKITGIQFTWNMENIRFALEYHETDQLLYGYQYRGWMMVPDKYSVVGDKAGFWNELTGNEHIDFSFRSIVKGYSAKGVQNYGYEDTEQAIIDEQHKYTPRLDEPLTNFFLYDSGYMSNIESKKNRA